MKKNNFFLVGIVLIVLGVLGIVFTPGSTEFGPMGGMMGPQGMMGRGGMMGPQGMMGNRARKTTFSSNGERIYYTATSESGNAIVASMGSMTMSSQMMSCVDCHGEAGKGGAVQTPMGAIKAADITHNELTGEEEPPYTDRLIKRAITKGLDHKGKRLDLFMPRWSMADEDLDDLVDYLRTLK